MAAPTIKSKLLFVSTFIILATISGWLFLFMYTTQPKPYMDEVFHIPQAQNYCVGKFEEWDPKITTLPGLYLISVGILNPLSYVTGMNFCDVFYLRCTNIIFTLCNFYLFYCIINRLHSGSRDFSQPKAVFLALTLATFPTLYFFSFLYYTDVASCFFVLLMYLFHLHGHAVMAAIIGLLAIVMRQTNVIWVAFIGMLTAAEVFVSHLRLDKKETKMDTKTSPKYFKILFRGLINMISHQRKRLPLLGWDLMESCLGFLVVGIAFAVFLHQNKGIVVGDKSAHQACIHSPQLLYFLAYTLVFAFPYFTTISKFLAFLRSLQRNLVLFIAFALAALLAVSYNIHVHKYLLADNRHYTFYVWRRIFQAHDLARYVLIPVYVYAGWALAQTFQTKDAVWKTAFATCIIASTVPQKLLEFRYFIVPYILVRLHMPMENYLKLMLEFMLYCAVNAATIYLFVAKPFLWEDSADTQRFIW